MSEDNNVDVQALSDKIYEGTVEWFSRSSGFGFINWPGGDIVVEIDGKKTIQKYNNDMFVHFSDLVQEGFKFLKKNQRVQFKVGKNNKGQPKAIEVVVIA